ncbi:KLTH0G17204p [Lachancea thermotolerans CBS 6340]|uniref:KLTH0G17204p n=1 Tax=Lachancea thermotolerans (strain ATCC 56472 / CBS 6340 / NRRL Y-8284) TaxID=559295 RepID=C5DNI0_LACTC|nr:KLTH0G17204p [Lachancea thermotolerans CBS 6340]CAR25341.1 KLTH0G17204p [Lachancea thermotolerans CBS 6340]
MFLLSKVLLTCLLSGSRALHLPLRKDVELALAPIVVSGLLQEATSTVHVTQAVASAEVVSGLLQEATSTVHVTQTVASAEVVSSAAASSVASASATALPYTGSAGITYSPYQKNGQCKTESMVQSDLAQLHSFGIIRIYDTDCEVLGNVVSALTGSQKIMIGIWNIQKIQDSVDAISAAFSSDFSKIYAVSIGNELVNSGQASVSEIQSAVSTARDLLGGIGFTGQIVTVDTLVAVSANPALCECSDFIAVNCHPYWDGNVEPSDCGTWLQQQIASLQTKCGTAKQVLITETGWPNFGSPNGKCNPSASNMQTCINAISSSVGSQAILFSTYNDYWKPPGPYNVEQRWGIFGDPAF